MKRTNFACVYSLAVVTAMAATASAMADSRLGDADLVNAYKAVEPTGRTAVHDPSVVVDTLTDATAETFYVFGSHMGVSRSKDLAHWTSDVTGGERTSATLYGTRATDGTVTPCAYDKAFARHEVTTVTALVDGVAQEVPFGNFDAAAWNTAIDNYTVRGNLWAPDVVYNPTMGKWLYYVSLNGARWNSVIVCMAADRVEGPYVYQGPVVFSGFNVDADSPDYTASDMPIVLGSLDALPARYARGGEWGTYWPHAIDPCVFYDAEGKLWMAYGSWSGGIYILELDETTGLRDYTVAYAAENNTSASVTSDPYFGRKIAGGYYVSGEGAYIEKIGDWYYLFVSYGFYSPDGGYEMRVFRSAAPDGPYRDCSSAAGTSAIYTSYQMNYGPNAATSRGMKLMGGYQWDVMPMAELAQGHNSATTDREGRSFVVYHTKFNNGTAWHAVRAHQLFTNEDGWIVAAPMEFAGETATQDTVATTALATTEEIVGTYQIIRHTYKADYEHYAYARPATVTLHADGSVDGDMAGAWVVAEGSSFVTLTLGGIAYKGVFCRQTIDYTDIPALCFTAVSSSDGTAGSTRAVALWGVKAAPVAAIAYTADHLVLPFAEGDSLYADLVLPDDGLLGCSVEWATSDAALVGTDGTVATVEAAAPVTLTVTISKDGYSYEKSYALTVAPVTGDCQTGLVAYYPFDDSWRNAQADAQVAVPLAEVNGTKPVREYDAARGSTVVRQYFGYPSASSSSYVRFRNPLAGAELADGATVALYVARTADNSWDAIWSFLDEDDSDGVTGRLYLTANTYLGFNGTGGWWDANYPTTTIGDLGLNEWHHLALTLTATGWEMYIDGRKRYDERDNVSFNKSDDFTDYAATCRLLASAAQFYFGYGSWWGSAPLLLDDLAIYDRALSADDVLALYVHQKKGDFAALTAIETVRADAVRGDTPAAIYDLTGRRVVHPTSGLYIVGGRKVWINDTQILTDEH